jgi:palmitoyltransferase
MTDATRELKLAASEGDFEKVRSLVEAGVDANAADEHGSGTLLTFHPEIVTYLLDHGADPNSQTNENGSSVLAGLAFVNKIDCVRILLQRGADPNHGRVASLETPLHHAIAGAPDSEDLIQLLIDHGADVNAKTQAGIVSYNFWRDARTRGETPLHRAAAFASVKTIEVMLKNGADRTIRDANGDSPLGWASWHRRPWEFIDMLNLDVNDQNTE